MTLEASSVIARAYLAARMPPSNVPGPSYLINENALYLRRRMAWLTTGTGMGSLEGEVAP
jgi:hypothetical protein